MPLRVDGSPDTSAFALSSNSATSQTILNFWGSIERFDAIVGKVNVSVQPIVIVVWIVGLQCPGAASMCSQNDMMDGGQVLAACECWIASTDTKRRASSLIIFEDLVHGPTVAGLFRVCQLLFCALV